MKILKYIVLSLLIIGHVSCSNDDNAESLDVVGSWRMTEGSVDPGSMDLDLGGTIMHVEYSGGFSNIDPNNRLNLHEDHTFTTTSGGMTIDLTLVVMGQSQTQSVPMDNFVGDGTWEINGRDLNIRNSNGTSIKYNIDNLSDDTLELSANVKDITPDGGSNPMLESMDMIVRMKLKRV